MKACANLSYQAEQMNDEVGYEQARGIEVFGKVKCGISEEYYLNKQSGLL